MDTFLHSPRSPDIPNPLQCEFQPPLNQTYPLYTYNGIKPGHISVSHFVRHCETPVGMGVVLLSVLHNVTHNLQVLLDQSSWSLRKVLGCRSLGLHSTYAWDACGLQVTGFTFSLCLVCLWAACHWVYIQPMSGMPVGCMPLGLHSAYVWYACGLQATGFTFSLWLLRLSSLIFHFPTTGLLNLTNLIHTNATSNIVFGHNRYVDL